MTADQIDRTIMGGLKQIVRSVRFVGSVRFVTRFIVSGNFYTHSEQLWDFNQPEEKISLNVNRKSDDDSKQWIPHPI